MLDDNFLNDCTHYGIRWSVWPFTACKSFAGSKQGICWIRNKKTIIFLTLLPYICRSFGYIHHDRSWYLVAIRAFSGDASRRVPTDKICLSRLHLHATLARRTETATHIRLSSALHAVSYAKHSAQVSEMEAATKQIDKVAAAHHEPSTHTHTHTLTHAHFTTYKPKPLLDNTHCTEAIYRTRLSISVMLAQSVSHCEQFHYMRW